MSEWRIRPRDPLILSDGRPLQTGLASPMTLDMPWPSSVVGMYCTYIGRDEDGFFALDDTAARELHSRIRLKGPLLATEDTQELIVSVPHDALWVADDDELHLHQLVPERLLPEADARAQRLRQAIHDFEDKSGHASELVYPMIKPLKGKPTRPHAYWKWSQLESWLTQTKPHEARSHEDWADIGIAALSKGFRTHVTLCSSFSTEGELRQRAALDGHLFGTWNQHFEDSERRYSLWADLDVDQDEENETVKQNRWAHLGGEKRLVELSKSQITSPTPSVQLLEKLKDASLVRVVLLTPAIFEAGDHPTWLLEGGHSLVAQSVGRPQMISGWDIQKGKPKAAKRMAPAGSVYWIELAEGTSAEDWTQQYFMTCVSDKLTDRHHGFGLCVIGAC